MAASLKCLEALQGLVPAASADSDLDPPAFEDQDLPRDFGPYELLEEIGRGGMGVVYKARQKALDRTVAVKMILATHLASPEHIRRFQVEAWAAARLRHSNITQIHDVGQHHGQHYFTMEYVEGESLAERIARQRLSFDAIVRLLSVVARAVEHLHAQGVVHRDLKPSNILLDRDDQPYVTDFGLAKVFVPGSEATATGVIAGTPSYMAPEQASGHNSEVGPAADIYSLGAILYELLTGEPPFRQENPLDTLLDILGREPRYPRQLNPRVPHGLELICLKCLAKSPADRYAFGGRVGRRPGAVRPARAAFRSAAELDRAVDPVDPPQAGLGLAVGGPGRFLSRGDRQLSLRRGRLAFPRQDHDPRRRLGRDCDRLPAVRRPRAAGGAGPFCLGHARFAHALDRVACSWPTAPPVPWWSAIRC